VSTAAICILCPFGRTVTINRSASREKLRPKYYL